MSQFMRFFSGKFQNLGNCAGVKKIDKYHVRMALDLIVYQREMKYV